MRFDLKFFQNLKSVGKVCCATFLNPPLGACILRKEFCILFDALFVKNNNKINK